MRMIWAMTALLALPALAAAQGRPSTPAMTCRQAAGLVASRGAVVLSTSRDIYDRYVRSETMCETSYYGRPAFVPTRDNPQCFIGYYCSATPPMFSR